MVEELDTILTDPDEVPDMYDVINRVHNDGHLSAEELFNEHWQERFTNILVYHWIPEELNLVKEFVPTVYHKVAGQEGVDESEGLAVEDIFYRLALQFETRLINESSFIDATILNQWHDQATLNNKVRRIIKTSFVAFILGIGQEFTVYTRAFEQAKRNDTLDEFLVDIKRTYVDFYHSLPDWFVETETTMEEEDDTKERLPFVDEVVELVGRRNVAAIVLYGSASRETDPSLINDYDCYLVVRDGKTSVDLYRNLRKFSFTNSSDGKPVSFNVVEESVFPRFIRMEHDAYEASRTCKVLYGYAEFPLVDSEDENIPGAVSSDEVKLRGLSHGMTRIVSLKAASGSSVKRPDEFRTAEKYFRNYIKTQRFLVQACLNHSTGLALRSKREYDEVIQSFDGEITPYTAYPEKRYYYAEAICRASACSSAIVEQFLGDVTFKIATNPSFTPDTRLIKPNMGYLSLSDLSRAFFMT